MSLLLWAHVYCLNLHIFSSNQQRLLRAPGSRSQMPRLGQMAIPGPSWIHFVGQVWLLAWTLLGVEKIVLK